MTNKALSFGYVAVLSQFCAAAFCGVRQDDVEQPPRTIRSSFLNFFRNCEDNQSATF